MQLLPLIEARFIAARKFREVFHCRTAEQNATLDANSWILHSFTYDGITIETEDLIDLQSDFGMKALFKETPYVEFWVYHLPKYRSTVEKVIFVLIQITTTYLWNSVFSCLKIKSC